MVYNVTVVASGNLQYGLMSGARGHSSVLLQYSADAFKGTKGRIAYGIGYTVIRAAPAPFAPHKIVFVVADKHNGTFHISFGRDFAENSTVFKRQETCKVVLQSGDVAMSPTALDHVILTVFFTEYKLVDVL